MIVTKSVDFTSDNRSLIKVFSIGVFRIGIAMAEWQPYLQSIIIGFTFSFLLAKLFSSIFPFQEDNLLLRRADSSEDLSKPLSSESPKSLEKTSACWNAEISRVSENEPLIPQKHDITSDWEGVESTELEEAFSAATVFVAATAADRSSPKVSTDLQLQLYALYKIATEGPCSAPQPSALKMTARAKWQAWQKLGAMPPEEAMQKYLTIVTELCPTWAAGATTKRKGGNGSDTTTVDSKGPMGPVFSTYVYEEESGNELKMEAIHAFAREGDVENLLRRIENGVSVDLKDSEGRTALHWAVDRGHLNITKVLVTKNADLNAKDNEGQTPLHYAAVCERESITKFLVKENADTDVKDNDSNCPHDLSELNWHWMQHAVIE